MYTKTVVAAPSVASASEHPRQSFGAIFKTLRQATPTPPVAAPGGVDISGSHPQHFQATALIDHLAVAQNRMERVLALAESGRHFTPAELLSLQTSMYQSTQELDLAGKVVEKATSGIRQILQTQI